MARESTLSIKQKWALDSQLGEMLRSLEKPAANDQRFEKRLNALIDEYGIAHQDVLEIVLSMRGASR